MSAVAYRDARSKSAFGYQLCQRVAYPPRYMSTMRERRQVAFSQVDEFIGWTGKGAWALCEQWAAANPQETCESRDASQAF